ARALARATLPDAITNSLLIPASRGSPLGDAKPLAWRADLRGRRVRGRVPPAGEAASVGWAPSASRRRFAADAEVGPPRYRPSGRWGQYSYRSEDASLEASGAPQEGPDIPKLSGNLRKRSLRVQADT